MVTLGRTKYRVRILYKSGNSHCFWVYNFNWENDGKVKQVSWEAVEVENSPIDLGVSEIEAMYRVGYKKSIWELFSRE